MVDIYVFFIFMALNANQRYIVIVLFQVSNVIHAEEVLIYPNWGVK